MGKKILSVGILYNLDNVCKLANDGELLPFSQLTKVFFEIFMSFATSSCVSPAFTLAAARLICNVSNCSQLLSFPRIAARTAYILLEIFPISY